MESARKTQRNANNSCSCQLRAGRMPNWYEILKMTLILFRVSLDVRFAQNLVFDLKQHSKQAF